MEQETLYAAAKWDMLKALEAKSKSPFELAEHSNTSVSNVSQSLRLLEMAGIVRSERVGNRDKGQPRVLYSLAGNSAYLIVTAMGFVQKKQLVLDEYKKIVMKIWFYENESWHPYLLRAVNDLLGDLDKINGLYLDKKSVSEIKLLVVPGKGAKKEYKDTNIEVSGASRKIKFSVIDEKQATKDSASLYAIYDPLKLMGGEN